MRKIYLVRYEENINEIHFFGEELKFNTREEAVACLKEKAQVLKKGLDLNIYEIKVDTDEELEIRDKEKWWEYFHYIIEWRWIENEPIEVSTSIGTLVAREVEQIGNETLPSPAIGFFIRQGEAEKLLSLIRAEKDMAGSQYIENAIYKGGQKFPSEVTWIWSKEEFENNKEEEFTMTKEMKIEVKQVPPEAQESYWMIDGEPDNIVLFGNRDYSEHWGKWGDISRDYENCIDSFNEDFTSKGEPIEEGFFTSLEELTEYYLSPYGYKYRTEDEETWISLFLNDDCYDKEVWVPVVLNLIERKPYRFSVLRGDCQSDWQYIVFSPDDYPSENAIREMEAEYFNTGSEWHVDLIEDEELIDSFNFYSEEYLDSKEEILEAVCKQMGYIANAAYEINVCTGYRTEPVFETL